MISASSEAAGRVHRFTTLAGLALTGSADGPASAARFAFPQAVAADPAGNVYVADTSNHTIRKITPAGLVSTLAGSAGSAGSTDGTGSAARFNFPAGVAVDSAGNLYVADISNNTIRKITPAGIVSTLAGQAGSDGSTNGPGSAARFSGPRGVAVDTAGNVYVADFGNSTIRKITPAGLVTTLAGLAGSPGSTDAIGSAARFSGPKDTAVDAAGNVYVADMYNSTIRKITPAGSVSTLAGLAVNYGSVDGTGSAARFSFPAGLALDQAGNIYVADSNNYTIRRVTPAGAVTTLAGLAGTPGSAEGTGSAARFSFPQDVAVDTAGTVYVADYSNSTIRSITPSGTVSTFAGPAGSTGSTDGPGAVARFSSPQGVAVDTAGTTYVADTGNNTIRKITVAGIVSTLAGLAGTQGSTDGTGSAARFEGPYGVATDAAGNVYVADISNSTIRKITPAGVVTTLAGMAGQFGSTDGTGSAARFDFPASVAVDGAGTVYVADFSSSIIRKITPAGVVTTLAGLANNYGSADGTGSAARFLGPLGIAVDPAGNLYVADNNNHTIRKITPAGVVSTLAGLAEQPGSTDGTGSAARFSFPQGVAVDAAGNVYVADRNNSTIRKITPAGAVTTVAGSAGGIDSTDGIGSATRFSFPSGIAVDGASNLYVADSGNNTIRKAITTVAQRVSIDYDGDSKADLTVYRHPPGYGSWYVRLSTTGFTPGSPTRFGLSGDLPVPGDYDGDGKTDLALYRPTSGTWFLRLSGTGADVSYALGRGTDIPVPGDYDGDGRTDVAIYRWPTGVWSVLTSSSNYTATQSFQWGLNGDVPAPGDYDGDGRTDRAVFRPSNGTWYITLSSTGAPLTFQWGVSGDIPVPGDYDGDSLTDVAVFRQSEGLWYLLKSSSGFTSSSTFSWGAPNDTPVPGDYDGDGTTDLAVFRPATGIWFVRLSTTGYTTSIAFQWGVSTDIPVPSAIVAITIPRRTVANLTRTADFDGDGRADIGVYRPSLGTWFYIPSVPNQFHGLQFLGQSGDLPVPNDYDGDGTTDFAVYRPTNGTWFIQTSGTFLTPTTLMLQWGLSGDVPVPGDYDGDGKADVAVYRPSTGNWYVLLSSTNFTTFSSFQWGSSGDVPLTGDYDGDGTTDLVVWRPSTGTWFIRQSSTGYATSVALQWGLAGDIPVPGDYDGDGRTDLGVYRPSTQTWILLRSGSFTAPLLIQFGVSTDTPVPADFDGDGRTDLAVYRPSTGTWFLLLSSTNFASLASVQWGLSGDIPTFRQP